MAILLEDFKHYLDKWGLIAQHKDAGADGGDSAHRFGIIFSCLKILKQKIWISGDILLEDYYLKAMVQYEKQDNLYVRHPNPDKWYSNPLNFSRDQTTMLMKAMMVMGDTGGTFGIIKKLFSRGGFHQNLYPNYAKPGEPEYKRKIPDIITPSQISDWLRSYRSNYLYPIICVLDVFKFVDVVLAELDDSKSRKKGKRTDYFVMLATDVIVSRYVQDTFVMRAVAKYLSKTDYRSSIEWIFDPKWSDPPIDKLLLPLAERYIDNVK